MRIGGYTEHSNNYVVDAQIQAFQLFGKAILASDVQDSMNSINNNTYWQGNVNPILIHRIVVKLQVLNSVACVI